MKYSQLSRYGAIAKMLPFTTGKIFFVVPSSETFLPVMQEMFPVDEDGVPRVYTTVQAAYDATTSGNDDVIILSTNAAHELAAQLTISKSRVHFIGDLWGRSFGQRAKINYADGIATALPFAVKNIAVGTTFEGIKFLNNNTDAQVVGTVGEGGEYALYKNCEFYNSTNLDSDTVAELVLGGDSPKFINCTFGSLADAVSGNKIRPAILIDGSVVTGGAGTTRDAYFDNCRLWKKAGGTTTAHVYVAADADIERDVEFHDCQFVANMLGATPAVAIALAASLTNGAIRLTGDTAGYDVTKLATGTGVISCLNAKVATATIGLQCT
jgi:hypothetical protein